MHHQKGKETMRLKLTSVIGYTDAPKPDREAYEKKAMATDDLNERVRIMRDCQKAIDAWRKIYVLRGHWNPTAAARFARRHGVISAIEITHSTRDLNGKGYSSIDARWIVEGDEITPKPISEIEQADYVQQVDDDVWAEA